MILWVLVALAVAVFCYLRTREVATFLLGLVAGVVVGFFVAGLLGLSARDTVHDERERELVAAGDRFSAEARGSFVLVVGSFSSNETFTYHYFFRHPDGGIEHAQADSGDLLIYEDREPGDAVLTERRECWVAEPAWWHLNARRSCDNYWEPHGLHVPPGSVTRDISFDLE